MDFVIMKKIAAFADRTPSLRWMNLAPSMEQFSHTMTAQVHKVSWVVYQALGSLHWCVRQKPKTYRLEETTIIYPVYCILGCYCVHVHSPMF